MADEKISAMPPATQLNDADVIPIVQGGVNKTVTRSVFLAAPALEVIDLSAGGTTLGIDIVGNLQAVLNAGAEFEVIHSSGSIISIDSAGVVNLDVGTTGTINIGPTPGQGMQFVMNGVGFHGAIHIVSLSAGTFDWAWGATLWIEGDSSGVLNIRGQPGKKVIISVNSGSITIGATGQLVLHDPTVGGPKISFVATTPANWTGAPTDLPTAVNRLAAAVAGLLGGPIP